MLEFLDLPQAAQVVYKAVDESLGEGRFVSPDLGGKASTQEVLDDVLKRL